MSKFVTDDSILTPASTQTQAARTYGRTHAFTHTYTHKQPSSRVFDTLSDERFIPHVTEAESTSDGESSVLLWASAGLDQCTARRVNSRVLEGVQEFET